MHSPLQKLGSFVLSESECRSKKKVEISEKIVYKQLPVRGDLVSKTVQKLW